LSLQIRFGAWVLGFGFREFFFVGRIQRFQQTLTRRQPVRRNILEAVRCPHIAETRRSELASELCSDPPAGFAVVDPELPDRRIRMAQGQSVIQFFMRIISRSQIQTDLPFFRPRQPAGIIVDRQRIAVCPGNIRSTSCACRFTLRLPLRRLIALSRSARSSSGVRARPG